MSWELDASIALDGFHVPGETPELRTLAIAEAARVFFDRIVAVWPVDTSRSLAGFRTLQEGATWYVRNLVEYTQYVHGDPKNGGPPGLADRTVVKAMPAARATARRELKRVVKVSQTVGARGRFVLRRTAPPPTSPLPFALTQAGNAGRVQLAAIPAAQRAAVREAMAVMAPMVEANTAPLGVSFFVQNGMLQEAAEVLRRTGRVREARRIEAIARRRAA